MRLREKKKKNGVGQLLDFNEAKEERFLRNE